MDDSRYVRAFRDYFIPLLVPGAAVVAFFFVLFFIPFGGFQAGAQISQVILNLIDTALVIGIVFIFSFSLRYFRARGFYFLVLLMIQMLYLQQMDTNPDGAYWTLIFVPCSFLIFLLISERGLFSPRTRLLLIIIGLPVLLRFVLEQYGRLNLTAALRSLPFPVAELSHIPALSPWSLMLYVAALAIALLRFIIRPDRDLAAVLWLELLSLGMVFITALGKYPSVVRQGLGGNQLTPEYMFLAGAGIEPGMHALLGLFVLAATLIEVITLFDISYRMAYLDQLTGLPGRRAYDQAIRNLGKRYCIAMVDIDHFKSFNDSYGHDVGDQVLKLVGQILKNNSKPGTAYRYGGEEFVVVYPGSAYRDVAEAAERLRRKIGAYPFALRKFLRPPFPPEKAGPQKSASQGKTGRGTSDAKASRKNTAQKKLPKTLTITVSMGLADHANTDLHPEEVMKNADTALYKAKEGGRNRLEIFR